MKPANVQRSDPLMRETLGTVVRQSTAEQRQAFLERIYGDYEELQRQKDEAHEHKRNLDADFFQSHQKEIHDLLFEQTDVSDSELGDWDTWERVETLIKHTVYARPANFSPGFPQLKGYTDRIEVLNKALVDQRIRMNSFNVLLNQQHQEILAWKNLLLLKEREIRTLRSQNNVFSLEMRHAKREVSRIRGTKIMVEEDELLQDFKLLLAANKELEKENASLRAKMYDKYGAAGMNPSLQRHLEREAREAARQQNRVEFSTPNGTRKPLPGIRGGEKVGPGGVSDRSLEDSANGQKIRRVRENSSGSLEKRDTFSAGLPSKGAEVDFWSLPPDRNSLRSMRGGDSIRSDLLADVQKRPVGASLIDSQKRDSGGSGEFGGRKQLNREGPHDAHISAAEKKFLSQLGSRSLSKSLDSYTSSAEEVEEMTGMQGEEYAHDGKTYATKSKKGGRKRSTQRRFTHEGIGRRSTRSSSVGFFDGSLDGTAERKNDQRGANQERRSSSSSIGSKSVKPSSRKGKLRRRSMEDGGSGRGRSVGTRRSSDQRRSSRTGAQTERKQVEEDGISQRRGGDALQDLGIQSVGKKRNDQIVPRTMGEWKDAVTNKTARAGILTSTVPVSAALVRIKKANMALQRRMEEQCENMLEHLDYDANTLFINAELHFTVPEFAFSETGSFTHFSGFHMRAKPPEAMMAWHEGKAQPSGKKLNPFSIASVGSSKAARKTSEHHGTLFSEESGADLPSLSNPSHEHRTRNLPSRFPVRKLSSVRALGLSSSRHTALLKSFTLQRKRNEAEELTSSFCGPSSIEETLANGTSASISATVTPYTSQSNTKSWNALKQGILGIAALSRAECLKREALHVLQLRQKIAFQQKQMDKLGLKHSIRELLTPLIMDVYATEESSSGDDWQVQSASVVSVNERGIPPGSEMEKESGSLKLGEGLDELDLSLLSSSERSSMKTEDMKLPTKNGSATSPIHLLTTAADVTKTVSASRRGFYHSPHKGENESTLLSSGSESNAHDNAFESSLLHSYPETAKMRSLTSSILFMESQGGENPRVLKGVPVMDRGVDTEVRRKHGGKGSKLTTGSESESNYSADTGRKNPKGMKTEPQEGGGKKAGKYKKIGSVVHMEHSSNEEEEAIMRRHNILKDPGDVASYFSSEGSASLRERNVTSSVIRGKRMKVHGYRHERTGRGISEGLRKPGKTDDVESPSASSPEEEKAQGIPFYHRFMGVLKSKDAGASVFKVFQLLQSELLDLRRCAADIKERHLEMYNEVQELLSLLQSILSCIDVVVEERVHREVAAITSGTYPQGQASHPNNVGRFGSPFEGFTREVAQSVAQEKASSLLFQMGIRFNHPEDASVDRAEMVTEEASQANGPGLDKKNAREQYGEETSRRFHNVKWKVPKLNVESLTDDEWVAQHLEHTAQDVVKRKVQSAVKPFCSSPVFHYYVGYPERDKEAEVERSRGGKGSQFPSAFTGANPSMPFHGSSSSPESEAVGGGALSSEYYTEDKYFLFDSESPERYGKEGEIQAKGEMRTKSGPSTRLSRITNELVRLLLGEDPSRSGTCENSEGNTELSIVPSESQESAPKRPRHLSLCGLMNQMMYHGNEDGGEDYAIERQAGGPTWERKFQHVVMGEKLHINSPHPLAGLFPALFYDQETSIDGSWRRIPIGSNTPKVRKDGFLPTPAMSANSASVELLRNAAKGKDFTKMGSKGVQHMLRELRPHFISAAECIRPKVTPSFLQGKYASSLNAAKQELSSTLKHILSDEFTDFVHREVLPIAKKAQEFSSASSRVDNSTRQSLRELRRAEEERQKQHTSRLLRRVGANIRMRLMLAKPRYQGNAFVEYLGLLYRRWRSQQWKEEAAYKEEAKAMQLQLLDALDLARRPTPYDRNMLSEISGGDRRTHNPGKMRFPGHFQTEKSSFHFEKVHLPFDPSTSQKQEEIKRLHESKKNKNLW